MKKILFTVLLIGIVFSQTPGLSQGFGFAAGMQSGIGFSYRNIGEKHGVQFTIGAIGRSGDNNSFPESYTETYDGGWVPETGWTYTEISDNSSYFWTSVGALYIKPLHRAEKSMFFGFAGISTIYDYEKYYERTYHYVQESETQYTYEPTGSKREIKESDLRIFGGIGLGISYNLTKNITISLELPLTVSDEGDIWMIVPQGSIHYFYK